LYSGSGIRDATLLRGHLIENKNLARDSIAQIAEVAAANGLMLSSDQLSLLTLYAAMLVDVNQELNLISRQDEDNIYTRHILHSLTLAMPGVLGRELPAGQILDLGTGGGLPGIPLAIALPHIKFTLCDSVKKKIIAVRSIIEELGIRNARAVVSRAEELRRTEKKIVYDAVVTRAVAPIEDLVKWTHNLLKPKSTIFALKGGDLREEIKWAKRLQAIRKISTVPLKLQTYDAFDVEEKVIVIVELN
jgi:16S rRNA (guanine527-N7)-methyltransferase